MVLKKDDNDIIYSLQERLEQLVGVNYLASGFSPLPITYNQAVAIFNASTSLSGQLLSACQRLCLEGRHVLCKENTVSCSYDLHRIFYLDTVAWQPNYLVGIETAD